jgi:hypothetical protein
LSAFIHLLEYRVSPGHEAEVTGLLRHGLLAGPLPDGMVARFAGRRLSGQRPQHVVATTWRDSAALARATDRAGLPLYLAEQVPLLGETVSSRYRLVSSTGLGRESAKILRLYRNSIAVDAVESWERRAVETVARLATTGGLLVAEAGLENDGGGTVIRDGDARIAVLTAWTEWDTLIAATGGRLERALLATELVDLERPASPDHFELTQGEPGPG